jgi:hypothetical protein
MKKLLLSTSLMFLMFSGFSQNFSVNEYTTIYEGINGALTKYNEMSALICDTSESKIDIEQSFFPQFISVFYSPDKTFVYNDLDPTHKTSPEFSVSDYAKNMVLFYPNKGLKTSLKIEAVKYGYINFNAGVNQYEMDIQVEKTLEGWFMDEQQFKKTIVLQFKFTFNKTTIIENFKIAGIRNAPDIKTKSIDDKATAFFIDKKWWNDQNNNWKTRLKDAAGFLKEPEDKDLLFIRQLVTVDKQQKLMYSASAFSINKLVVEIVPIKKKGKKKHVSGIIVQETKTNFTLQTDDGKMLPYPKSKFKISA